MEENLVVIRNHVRNSIAIISHRSKPTTRWNLCADQKNVKIKIKYLKSQMTMLFFEVFLFTKKIIFSPCIRGKFFRRYTIAINIIIVNQSILLPNIEVVLEVRQIFHIDNYWMCISWSERYGGLKFYKITVP